MIDALRNAVQIKELRNRILYTLGMLLLFRVGSYIPVPGVDATALAHYLQTASGNVFGLLDLFSGGALSNFSLFALGVNPYITSSIIVQLLTVVIPSWEEMAKEGVEGRKALAQYTRWGTVLLGIVQGLAVMALAVRAGVVSGGFFGELVILVSLTAGTMLLTWIGEIMTEQGIGNGVSILIFAGIVARLPQYAVSLARAIGPGGVGVFNVILYVLLALAVVVSVIFMQEGVRRVPVQYARRVVGRRMYGGQSTHIPLRVNSAGVMPVIFASSLLTFPATLGQWFPALSGWTRWIGYGSWGYNVVYALLVIFFTYFYTAVTFNPNDVADNLKKWGGFIPGLRPGRPTAEFLDRILTRITLVGAVFLAFIAIVPQLLATVTGIPTSLVYFGGTSILIVVGVALDTMKQLESQLLMRHYEGFLR
ncbi:MAG: preprotein translocase subunit SecY [Limnochordaceae bacterium]|nr:preprotein translocase subunit SecY [Limnochordaceae bacterium]